jgi:hypothetical protein
MKPTKCNTCQGQDLYYGRAGDRTTIHKPSLFTLGLVVSKYAVCLACGAVQMYLPPDELKTVKKWKDDEERST